MKAKAAFSKLIQPMLTQYMIDNYGKSYDTAESVKNSWRTTYPISDEIIEEIFVQIKTIEKTNLGPHLYLQTFQTLLSDIIADHICKYVKRSATYQNMTMAEIKAMIKEKIFIQKTR